MKKSTTARVLFCCLGNICRSPTAHGVFESMVAARGLQNVIEVDSCGTAHWHIGETPDERTIEAAAQRGYDLGSLRGRQVSEADFEAFDYILAMDHSNLENLEALRPADYTGVLALFLSFAPDLGVEEVPDPYYGDGDGFNEVLNVVEAASKSLLDAIIKD